MKKLIKLSGALLIIASFLFPFVFETEIGALNASQIITVTVCGVCLVTLGMLLLFIPNIKANA